MNLREFKETIDKLYETCGDVPVCVDLNMDELVDDTIYIVDGNVYSENVQEITPTYSDLQKNTINGICISNYIM